MKNIFKTLLIMFLLALILISSNYYKYRDRSVNFRKTEGYLEVSEQYIDTFKEIPITLSFFVKGNFIDKKLYVDNIKKEDIKFDEKRININYSEIYKDELDFKGYGYYTLNLSINIDQLVKNKDEIVLEEIMIGNEKFEIGRITVKIIDEPKNKNLEIKSVSMLMNGNGLGRYSMDIANVGSQDINIKNLNIGSFEKFGAYTNIGIYENYRDEVLENIRDEKIIEDGYIIRTGEVARVEIKFNEGLIKEEKSFILLPSLTYEENKSISTMCLETYNAGNYIDRLDFIEEIKKLE